MDTDKVRRIIKSLLPVEFSVDHEKFEMFSEEDGDYQKFKIYTNRYISETDMENYNGSLIREFDDSILFDTEHPEKYIDWWCIYINENGYKLNERKKVIKKVING